ncbi:hypothetical protein F4818DRAFT_355374 [Hypoxylon cercidicola]|nr:hypothetical protein F4818DRAFT_355374 [Hypoxylon cercidicola]
MAEVEFLLAFNWVLLPVGLQEFYAGLQEQSTRAKVAYDVATASIKLKCLSSDEAAVMAVCQAVLDKIVRQELASGWESGKKIAKALDQAKANEKYKEASALVFAPQEILRSSFRAIWAMPRELVDRGILLGHLVPDKAATNLEQLTGCTLRGSTDGHLMYIGADSSEVSARAQDKLNALAEHMARTPQGDTRCETFIYAEDQQDAKATLSYMEHGPRSHLTTFFLDRTKYDLEAESSTYGEIFKKGVVVSLWDDDHNKLISRPKDINPVTLSKNQNQVFRAFPLDWTYKPKERTNDPDPDPKVALPFHSGQNPMVTSWVAHLPQPDQMLPHSDTSVREARVAGYKEPDKLQPQLGLYDPRKPRRILDQAPAQPDVPPNPWHAAPSFGKTEEASAPSRGTHNGSKGKPESNAVDELTTKLKMLVDETRSHPLPVVSAEKPPMKRNTMSQQKPSRKRKTAPMTHPMFVHAISQKLVSMLSGLEMFTGDLSLKVNLGRLCLTEINDRVVWYEGSKLQRHAKPIQGLKNTLDECHVDPRDVMFTNILTAKGADANYISLMADGSGKRIWSGYKRRTVYEIACCATTNEGYFRFVIEVDGNDFSYQPRYLSGQACSLFVHCPKRSWDFEITLSKSPRLGKDYEAFAQDLVDHMRVVPQSSGVPNLEFILNKAYKVEMLLARTVNIASYERNQENDPSLLEIREVHDMTPLPVDETGDRVNVTVTQYPGFEQLGQLPMWYEVSMQSKIVNKAFEQNRELELGDKVDWSPDQLMNATAFDRLIRSAAEMVRNIDGVGLWGDNRQDAMHPGPEVNTGGASTDTGPKW